MKSLPIKSWPKASTSWKFCRICRLTRELPPRLPKLEWSARFNTAKTNKTTQKWINLLTYIVWFCFEGRGNLKATKHQCRKLSGFIRRREMNSETKTQQNEFPFLLSTFPRFRWLNIDSQAKWIMKLLDVTKDYETTKSRWDSTSWRTVREKCKIIQSETRSAYELSVPKVLLRNVSVRSS